LFPPPPKKKGPLAKERMGDADIDRILLDRHTSCNHCTTHDARGETDLPARYYSISATQVRAHAAPSWTEPRMAPAVTTDGTSGGTLVGR